MTANASKLHDGGPVAVELCGEARPLTGLAGVGGSSYSNPNSIPSITNF